MSTFWLQVSSRGGGGGGGGAGAGDAVVPAGMVVAGRVSVPPLHDDKTAARTTVGTTKEARPEKYGCATITDTPFKAASPHCPDVARRARRYGVARTFDHGGGPGWWHHYKPVDARGAGGRRGGAEMRGQP